MNENLLFGSCRIECGFHITGDDRLAFSRPSCIDIYFHPAGSLRLIDRDGRIQIDYFHRLADKPTTFINGRMPDYMELFTTLANVTDIAADITYQRGTVLDVFYNFKKPVLVEAFSAEWRDLICRCLETVGAGDE